MPSLHSTTGEMPLFSASVEVTLCSGCAANLSVLSVHTHSGAATYKPCRTVSTTDSLNRFTAAYILCLYRKKAFSKGDPSSSSMACREVVPEHAVQDAREAESKEAFSLRAAS